MGEFFLLRVGDASGGREEYPASSVAGLISGFFLFVSLVALASLASLVALVAFLPTAGVPSGQAPLRGADAFIPTAGVPSGQVLRAATNLALPQCNCGQSPYIGDVRASEAGSAMPAVKQLTKEEEKNMAAVVDKEKCAGCGTCVDGCPVEAIKIVDDKAVVDKDTCVGCGACVDACPCEAIKLED